MLMKPKIAFVVQRCGLEVNGGAESMCLAIALKMSAFWDIEILTSCATDYMTWSDVYPEGLSEYEGVRFRRFRVDAERNIEAFNKYSDGVLLKPHSATMKEAEEWMRLQGPVSSSFKSWVEKHSDDYQAFFFFTYLYAWTNAVFPIVAHKAVLIPNAHDEPPIYLPIFERLFRSARYLVCNTEEELRFLNQTFAPLRADARVVGLGMDLPESKPTKRSVDEFQLKHGIDSKYILYVGRIDPSKGCAQLFEYWSHYKNFRPSTLKLVLAGKAQMDVPQRDDIVQLGFVDDATKMNAIAGCEFLVNPSPFESLSIVLLEAWLQEKMTLVNGSCAVLKAQTVRSKGGLWFENYKEFQLTADYLLNHTWNFDGQGFVEKNYSWPVVIGAYQKILTEVSSTRHVSERKSQATLSSSPAINR